MGLISLAAALHTIRVHRIKAKIEHVDDDTFQSLFSVGHHDHHEGVELIHASSDDGKNPNLVEDNDARFQSFICKKNCYCSCSFPSTSRSVNLQTKHQSVQFPDEVDRAT